MKVLICGSRGWHDPEPMHAVVAGCSRLADGADQELVVIHGNARGADLLADQVARQWGAQVRKFPADWERFGKAAGPRRNTQMVGEQPDVVYAFRSSGKSAGTDNMVAQARAAGIPTYVITSDANTPDA